MELHGCLIALFFIVFLSTTACGQITATLRSGINYTHLENNDDQRLFEYLPYYGYHAGLGLIIPMSAHLYSHFEINLESRRLLRLYDRGRREVESAYYGGVSWQFERVYSSFINPMLGIRASFFGNSSKLNAYSDHEADIAINLAWTIYPLDRFGMQVRYLHGITDLNRGSEEIEYKSRIWEFVILLELDFSSR
ncbi:MAG: hypothetical protein AAFP19_00915 [Bacteroidota bacterium]